MVKYRIIVNISAIGAKIYVFFIMALWAEITKKIVMIKIGPLSGSWASLTFLDPIWCRLHLLSLHPPGLIVLVWGMAGLSQGGIAQSVWECNPYAIRNELNGNI